MLQFLWELFRILLCIAGCCFLMVVIIEFIKVPFKKNASLTIDEENLKNSINKVLKEISDEAIAELEEELKKDTKKKKK